MVNSFARPSWSEFQWPSWSVYHFAPLTAVGARERGHDIIIPVAILHRLPPGAWERGHGIIISVSGVAGCQPTFQLLHRLPPGAWERGHVIVTSLQLRGYLCPGLPIIAPGQCFVPLRILSTLYMVCPPCSPGLYVFLALWKFLYIFSVVVAQFRVLLTPGSHQGGSGALFSPTRLASYTDRRDSPA